MGAGGDDLHPALLGADLLQLVDQRRQLARPGRRRGRVDDVVDRLEADPPAKPTSASTTAYHLRERGTVNGSAATSATPANSIASRVMLEPICELITHTSTTARP